MPHNGFSLIELTVTLLITLILTAFAIPSFKHLTQQNDINTAAQRLFTQLQLAKTTAISSNQNVILCATNVGKQCSNNWSNGSMIFIDNDKNDQYDAAEDQLVNVENFSSSQSLSSKATQLNSKKKVAISWRSFRGNKPIRFIPMGITWHFNGTFTLCHSHNPKAAKAIFVAKSGRIEMSTDTDRDGSDEDRKGKPIACSK